jgi:hypothetical protein
MQKIPFKSIGIGCAIMTLLIVARCLVSIGRVLYYGGTNWLPVVQEDPWLYVAVVTAATSVLCFTMTILQERLQDREEEADAITEADEK